MGKIVTFYSYKGGTGRSMALANVAWVLAASGARTLVVDWDLEAPGLHRYFRPFLADKELTRLESQGVIDLMADFVARLATPENPNEQRDEKWYRSHADVSKWSRRLLWPSGQDARTDAGGTIEFVPAGRQGPQYAGRVNSFDWADFYDRYNGGAFIDAMRASMTKYDWVLIDSRTGVSDTSGICTVQLPDILVVCFTLNYQSIEGASAVARSAQAGRKSGGLRILPLPTRLDGNEERLLTAMMAYARRTFSPLMPRELDADLYWKEMGVPYFSRYAYSEKLAPFEEQMNVSTSTLPSMERLTSYITERAVTRLRPLPEEARVETLAEFEQLPEALEGSRREIPTAAGPAAPSALRRILNTVFPKPVSDFKWPILLTILVLGSLFGSLFGYLSERQSSSAGSLIPRLAAEARKQLEGGQREQAALLVAEAAGRLDPAAVVGPESDPAKQIYEAFLALQPLELLKQRATGTPARARTALISPDGRWIAVTGPQQETLLLRFPPQGQASTEREVRGYSAAAFSPDSRYFATGGRNGSFVVYDMASGRQVFRWENKNPDSAWANAVAFSPDGNLVAAGTDTGEVVIARVENWAELRVFLPLSESRAKSPAILTLAFTADSQELVAGSVGVALRLFRNLQRTPAEISRPVEGRPVRRVAMLPAIAGTTLRRVLAVNDQGAVYVWSESSAGDVHRTPIPVAPRVEAIALSQNGKLLALGSTDTHIWELADFQALSKPKITLTVGDVKTLSFSADGRWLASGSADGTMNFWDVASGQKLQQTKLNAAIDSVAFSPDNKYVVATAGDGLYAVLVQIKGQESFPASQIHALACSQTRETTLQAEQWKQFFGSTPIRFTCGAASGAAPRAAS